MKRGHVTGQRRIRHTDTAWYAVIEAATLATLEHTRSTPSSFTQEVPQASYATARPELCVTHRAIPVHPEHSEELSNGLYP